MATTFLVMQNEVLGFLGVTSGSGVSALRTRVKRFLNRAASDMWNRYPWKERKNTRFFQTLAPYTTGTLTTTQGSASVTGSGTTWVSAHTGMKIAASFDGPWYVFTRTGATTGTLDRDWVEASLSGSAYVLYQDRYSLSTSAEAILGREMVLHRQGYGSLGRIGRVDGEEVYPFPAGAGTPTWWTLQDVSGGAMRVRLGHAYPDAVYSVRYGCLDKYTEMSGDSDECVIPERFRHILIHGALREAYLIFDDVEKSMNATAMFDAGVLRAWTRHSDEEPDSGVILGADEVEREPERTVGTVSE